MSQIMTARPQVLEESARPQTIDSGPMTWQCVPGFREILRHLGVDWLDIKEAPGITQVKKNAQRSVWRIQRGDSDFFVKVYRPNGLAARLKTWLRGPTAKLEWDVGNYAADHGIPAVSPVACGWLNAERRTGPSWLVTETVPDAVPLADYWISSCREPRAARILIDVIARLIARAHQCGFHHRDMHASNILVRNHGTEGPQAFFVDLHDVQTARRVPTQTVLANLAQLNQWFRRHATRTQRLFFLNKYLDYRDKFGTASRFARNWQANRRKLLSDLDRRATTHAQRLWGKRDRRSNRNGRYFLRLRPARHWQALTLQRCKHARSGSNLGEMTLNRMFWQDHLSDPLGLVGGDDVTILKDSHTATVARIDWTCDDQPLPVVAKRALQRNLFKRMQLWFGHSRNQRTWNIANQLINRDLPTAHPLALIEKRMLGLIRTDSIIVTEMVQNEGDLEQFLRDKVSQLSPARQRVVKNQLIRALVRLVRDLHDRGFVHRDFKASNLLVCAPDGGDVMTDPQLVLIDTDGIYRPRALSVPRSTRQSMWRAVTRLSASLAHEKTVTQSDRARLLRWLLCTPGQSDALWRQRWVDLDRRTNRKLETKEQRRQWKLEHYGRE